MNRNQFFRYHARPHLNAKVIEVIISAGTDGVNWLPLGTLHMELHEWHSFRGVLRAAVRNFKDMPVGIEIEDGMVPRPVH